MRAGKQLLRFPSEPDLVCSMWADVLLGVMGWVDDGHHPLASITVMSASLSYDFNC